MTTRKNSAKEAPTKDSETVVAIPYESLVTIRTLMMMIGVQQEVLNNYVKAQLSVDLQAGDWELDVDKGVLRRATK